MFHITIKLFYKNKVSVSKVVKSSSAESQTKKKVASVPQSGKKREFL